ncbi:MAG: carboxypeptidase-like regulatory domain-containing protein [Bacteroidetes bacterium]|nr:carboxypeptidase-like regulatory domain-containing protein [Bacteroidota bacterium]
MKKYLFIFFFTLQAVLVSATVPGTQPVFLSGTVSDAATGETLAGVEIHIKGSSQVIFTDLEGRFTLADLPEGEVVLEFHSQFYEVKNVSVNVNANETSSFQQEALTIQLQGR